MTEVWDTNSGWKQAFEWSPRALFLVPASTTRQFRNLSGDAPVRLVHYSYLPLAMSVVTDPGFFLNNPYVRPSRTSGADDAYSEARTIPGGEGYRWINGQRGPGVAYWYGRLFPDLLAWDRLDTNSERGAGSKSVRIQFAGTDMSAHMSVFGSRTYKKAHRHGPGRAILIPGGEGYSVMWPEGKEKVVVRWQEGSMFVPPNRWFHQHFNLGAAGPLPGDPPADPTARLHGEGGQRQRPNRIHRRGSLGSRRVRTGARRAWSDVSDAGRGLHQSRLRLEMRRRYSASPAISSLLA